MKNDRAWTGSTPAGLRIPADLPSLDMESSITRSCHVPPGGILLEQDPPAYLTVTYQLPPWPSPRLFDDWWWRMPPPVLDALITGMPL